MSKVKIKIPRKKIADFCRRWQISEFALFGSVLRDDFRPDSDIDVLVSFFPEAPWSLFDFVTMQDELKEIFGRDVDFIEREALKNPFRKRNILNNMKVIYEAERS